MKPTRFAIVGAGNGGQTFAGHLASLGYDVSLFDVDADHVAELEARGVIELEGALSAAGRPRLVTTALEDAVADADVVLVVVPACYQEGLTERLAPLLDAAQIVVLNPGATGGALAVREIFRKHGKGEVAVAETGTLLYACRAERAGKVRVFAVKERVNVATLPASRTPEVLAVLNEPFPAFAGVANVLHTSLGNLNPLVHPAPTILNLGRLETGQSFEFYREGMTPTITRVVEKLDSERLAIAEAYDVRLPSLTKALRIFYGVGEDDLFEIFRNSRAHEGVMSPTSIDTRYLFEDVPTGLVPFVELGTAAGVATPTMRAVAELGSVVAGRDFWSEGRTLERLGLAGASVDEVVDTI